mgnify:CR=1 FL=1
MEVQERVAEFIRNTGIKQSFICERTGIRADAMSGMLTGKRRMLADEFEKICIALEKSPNDFMCIDQDGK